MTNIILCGGNGTRLWPVSRSLMPKQFVKLFENKSLFQLTIERNSKVCKEQIIVSNAEQYFLAVDQLAEVKKNDNKYILEPFGKNTAPSIAFACMSLKPDEIVLVTPSDHLITNETEFGNAINKAKKLALDNNLVTFGITPTYPETGFGYMKADGNYVEAFYEKPNYDLAVKYLEFKNYYWNSGMFCFKAEVYLCELKEHASEIYEACLTAFNNTSKNENNVIRIKHENMTAIPENSIDYAVMEKSHNVKMIPCDINWRDLGTFDALYKELPKDENNNTLNDKYISINSKNNLIYGNERLITTVDIDDCIIVDSGDALLVSKKGSSEKLKVLIQEVQKSTNLHSINLTTYRPWGTYTVLESENGYKIKKIIVNPGKRLSLQKHCRRSEHWIVLSGIATVTIGSQTKTIKRNESTYIKIGELHRLSNEQNEELVIIETQVGDYTEEDDIIRISDDFHR